jgi:hypothetical protein
VATTGQDILNAAYALSAKNRPGTIATEATELVKFINRAMRGLFAIAARVNPTYFAEGTPVVPADSQWARPLAAECLFRIEKVSDASEVVVVPFDDRKAEPSMPAVYEMGGFFRPAGNPNDPTGNLIFWHTRLPDDLANLASALDADWPEQHNDVLVYEVAIYLALKDGRMDEVAALRAEREQPLQLYIAHLEHATINTRSRFSQVRRFTTNSLVPLKALLAGGG